MQYLEENPNPEEDSLAIAKKEQAELKAYYDRFPDIDENIDETELNLTQVEELTESILHESSLADAEEWTTVYRVLHSLLEIQGIKCLFFDSTQEKNLHDITGNLAELDLEDRPFVVKLNNSDGLGDSVEPKTEYEAIRFVYVIDYGKCMKLIKRIFV